MELLRQGGVIAYPTDSAYALGCHIGDKKALDRIRQIRRVDGKHNFTLVCRDLSELSTYAKVDNSSYRLINAHTPGPYTFILPATRKVPKRLMHPKQRTIVRDLLHELGKPIMSSTLILPGEAMPMTNAQDIREALEHQLDLVIDGGHRGIEPTTVVDLTGAQPELRRLDKGDPAPFGAKAGSI